MTDTTDVAAPRSGSLSAMRIAELRDLASSLGLSVAPKARKADLVQAIKDKRGGSSAQDTGSAERGSRRRASAPAKEPKAQPAASGSGADTGDLLPPAAPDASDAASRDDASKGDARDAKRRNDRDDSRDDDKRSRDGGRDNRSNRDGDDRGERNRDNRNRGENRDNDNRKSDDNRGNRDNRNTDGRNNDDDNRNNRGDDDDERGGRNRRRNRQRGRDRKRGRGRDGRDGDNRGNQRGDDSDTSYSDDDVLVPVAGVLDVLDNYAFIRTTGYLPGDSDVYVPMGVIRKNGLRKGDAVVGAIKAPRDGDDQGNNRGNQGGGKGNNRGKFNALVRLDSINGKTPEESRQRPEFQKLTPLYPQDRLRLEGNDQKNLTNRIIDLVAPIGKGQRGLIVSPPKAGKTLTMQSIANAITENNPEVYLMIVLVDERPEEVTDFQRTVQGEVIASTFDRPPVDHTTVAELAIERAKRLVEMGRDVVVLLDGITRLGRAYNLAAPASGRILSGGVDSSALYPPKKFFGAARNIEGGGSLTILATALVDTGSKMDEVIYEEFKGTGNMELHLNRQLANRRIFPAVDVNSSGTRREEILMSPEELKITWKLRRVLSALDHQQGIELLLDRLRKTRNNYEFLTQVQQTSSIKLDDED